jgi:hypothetical protein
MNERARNAPAPAAAAEAAGSHQSGLAFAVGVPASADEQDLAGALASLVVGAERVRCPYEIVVAINGPEPAVATASAASFAVAAGLTLVRDDADEPRGEAGAPDARQGAGRPVLRLLRLARRSKAGAWNAIREATRAPAVVFADADVRVAPEAIPLLLARLAAEPHLAVIAGREVAQLTPADGLVARAAALPYRFDFGNVPGRLYALRLAALPEPMPFDVVAEDAYLTVRLGRARFAREPAALVYLRPPTTWGEYVRQRVRCEVGKLELARRFPELLATHGFGRTPWRACMREIALREYPLVAVLLGVRLYGHLRALKEVRTGIRTGWEVLPSTKRWPAEDARARSVAGPAGGGAHGDVEPCAHESGARRAGASAEPIAPGGATGS